MAKRRKPWHPSCRWSVEAISVVGPTKGQWIEVYCTGSKATAQADAQVWKTKVGTRTRVVPGRGHKSRRDS